MKKGLILALMAVALTALAVPTFAEAPVISELPIIIIGNADDMGTTDTTKSVFRYINALDLSRTGDAIDWKNPTYSDDMLHVFYTDALDGSGIVVRASDAAGFFAPATVDEIAAMAAGTPPTTGESIVSETNFWMSLMNLSAITTPSEPPASAFEPYIADIYGLETHDPASYQADLDAEPTLLTLVAAVTSGTTQVKASAQADLEVFSLLGETDQLTTPYVYQETTPFGKWISGLPTESWIVKPARLATGAAGFDVRTSDNPAGKYIFGSWKLGNGIAVTFPIPATEAEMAGRVYVARARLSNTASTSALCPGYRFLFINNAFTHLGGVEVTTTDDINAPETGADFTLTVCWEVPFNLQDMGDSGNLAAWDDDLSGPGAAADWRQYSLQFDLLHGVAGDNGILTLQEVSVEPIVAPATAAAQSSYSDLSTWTTHEYASVYTTQIADGTISKSASSITVQAGTDTSKTMRYYGAFPPIATGAGVLNGNVGSTPNSFASLTISASSVNPDTTPVVRLHVKNYQSGTFANRNVAWNTQFGAENTAAKKPNESWGGRNYAVTGQPNPTVPGATAVPMTLWMYTHGVVSEANDYLSPLISVMSQNLWATNNGATTPWPDDAGGIAFSSPVVKVY